MDTITNSLKIKEMKRIENVVINTINGRYRYEKRYVKNFQELKDVEQLLSRNTFIVELENNRITFLVANIISIEITDKNYVAIYS